MMQKTGVRAWHLPIFGPSVHNGIDKTKRVSVIRYEHPNWSGLRDLNPRSLGPKRLFEPGVTDGRSSFAGLCSFQPGLRRCCTRCIRVLRRSLWSNMWSYRNAPAGPAKSPSRGSVCIVTLIAKKVKLFFPARHRSFPICHSERSEESVSSPGQIMRRSRQRLPCIPGGPMSNLTANPDTA